MSGTRISCPTCGTAIDVQEVLEHQAEDRLREELSRKYKSEFEREKSNLVAEAQRKTEEQTSTRLKALELELNEREKQNAQLKQSEVEFLRLQQKMKSMEADAALALERRLLEERESIERAEKRKAEEAFELKQRELLRQVEDQKKLVEEFKRRAEQGSQQLQGEILELALEEYLASTFPHDTIEAVGKGVRGADCILSVSNGFRNVGMVVIECKRTKAFSNDWLTKLKSDMMHRGASLGILVTETLPKELERFGNVQGIWVCTYADFKPLIHVLRSMLLAIGESEAALENRDDKMSLLYAYLTGNEFKLQVDTIIDGFIGMKDELEKERAAMERIWKQREKQIQRILTSTAHMVGSIKGIAGSDISSIRSLELP